MTLKFDLVEMHERRAREQSDRALAVIAEFGGQKPERLFVPQDDPANNELVMKLVAEVLFLRSQIQCLGVCAHSTRGAWATGRQVTALRAMAAWQERRRERLKWTGKK